MNNLQQQTDIPEGIIYHRKYQANFVEGKWEEIEPQFGLEKMELKMIHNNNAPYNRAAGTKLTYSKFIEVEILRQNLSAQEINEIGVLSLELFQQWSVYISIPKILKEVESTVHKLNNLFIEFEISKTMLAEKGTFIDRLNISKSNLKQKLADLFRKLKNLGCIRVTQNMRGFNVDSRVKRYEDTEV